jgi:hypothetical protein
MADITAEGGLLKVKGLEIVWAGFVLLLQAESVVAE